MTKPQYEIAMSEQTLEKINEYQQNLISGKEKPGAFLQAKLKEKGKSVKKLNTAEFIEVILATKKPQFFAERAIQGGGKDWNNTELKILGDINVTVPVQVHDNGVWSPKDTGFKVHDKPLEGELLFTPGALLKSGRGFKGKTPDLAEVTKDGKIDQEAYNKLVERRMLPLLVHANEQAEKDGKPAIITMTGIGAGHFAGEFKGTMGEHLNQAMQAMLEKHGPQLTNIAAVHYDPREESKVNHDKSFGKLLYRVRPSTEVSNEGKRQLSDPSDLADKGKEGEFKNCKIYKIVAWDHVSLPGNDYFKGSRSTDDGVAAAATNSMEGITGIKGVYDKETSRYNPPPPPAGEERYSDWEDVAKRNGVHLIANDNIKIISNQAKSYSLKEFENQQQAIAKSQADITVKKGVYQTIKKEVKKLIKKEVNGMKIEDNPTKKTPQTQEQDSAQNIPANKKINTRINAVESQADRTLGKGTSKAIKIITSPAREVKKGVAGFVAEVDKGIKDLKKQVNAITKEDSSGKNKEIKNKVNDLKTELKDGVAGFVAEVDKGIKDLKKQVNTITKKDSAGKNKEVKNKVNDLKTELKDGVAGFVAEVQRGVEDLKSQAKNSELKTAVKELHKSIKPSLASMAQQIGEKLNLKNLVNHTNKGNSSIPTKSKAEKRAERS